MKIIAQFLCIISLTGHLVLAYPPADTGALSVRRPNAATTFAKMKWEGPIFPGQRNYVLYGDAREIYSQIKKINPSFDLRASTELSSTNNLSPLKQSNKESKHNIKCGHFPNGDFHDAWDQAIFLRALNAKCGAPAGPNVCVRLACENTTGSYLCNDNNFPIDVRCVDLSTAVNDVREKCFKYETSSGAGQIFIKDPPGYNVVVGYSNCRHDPKKRPDQYRTS